MLKIFTMKGKFFFEAPISYDEKVQKAWNEETSTILKELITKLESLEKFRKNERRNPSFW